ncbi:MAG: hypothetical protein IKJ01_02025 [Lachnospiraceae bacterium]|nr:hypothetical protein [Lachnospiraceae bacterium]
MTLEMITKNFAGKYVCVKDCIKDENNLIVSANVLKVYDSLEIAKDNASEIRKFMKKYGDFDIIYGNMEDYVRTRKNKNINHIVIDKDKQCSQKEIDAIIRMFTQI